MKIKGLLIFLLFFTCGCVTKFPVIDDTDEYLESAGVDGDKRFFKSALPIELNVSCFQYSRESSNCKKDFSNLLLSEIQKRKLFESVIDADNRLLESRQIIVRIDISTEGNDQSSQFFTTERSYTIRWRAWNLNGPLADFNEKFTYVSRKSADQDRLISWHMKLVRNFRKQLIQRKEFSFMNDIKPAQKGTN